tara:strand:+ start:553 stop:819 length:267 start_codon:yes stop_codon:yes gene_type:complete
MRKTWNIIGLILVACAISITTCNGEEAVNSNICKPGVIIYEAQIDDNAKAIARCSDFSIVNKIYYTCEQIDINELTNEHIVKRIVSGK